MGGPVDLESWIVLHPFEGVAGATPLVEANGDDPRARGDGGNAASRVYAGGPLGVLRDRARAAAAAQRSSRGRGGGDAGAGAEVEAGREGGAVLLHALHGRAAWAVGQLEGEIRSGLWTWAPGIGPGFAMSRPDVRPPGAARAAPRPPLCIPSSPRVLPVHGVVGARHLGTAATTSARRVPLTPPCTARAGAPIACDVGAGRRGR